MPKYSTSVNVFKSWLDAQVHKLVWWSRWKTFRRNILKNSNIKYLPSFHLNLPTFPLDNVLLRHITGGCPDLHFRTLHGTQIYTTHIYTKPKFTQPQIYTRPKFTCPQIYTASNLQNPDLHKPRYTQLQLYTKPKFSQSQIYTDPNFTTPNQPQFYNTKSAPTFLSKGKTTLF